MASCQRSRVRWQRCYIDGLVWVIIVIVELFADDRTPYRSVLGVVVVTFAMYRYRAVLSLCLCRTVSQTNRYLETQYKRYSRRRGFYLRTVFFSKMQAPLQPLLPFSWIPASVLQSPPYATPGTPGVEFESNPLVSPRYVLYGHWWVPRAWHSTADAKRRGI